MDLASQEAPSSQIPTQDHLRGSVERVGVPRRLLARSFGPSSSSRKPDNAFFNGPNKSIRSLTPIYF